MTFLWTDRAISELKRLCDLGCQFRAIAKQLGDECTKNMVIGKARRLRKKGWIQASAVSPRVCKGCGETLKIECNHPHTRLYCNNECKERKSYESKAHRRKAAASLRQPKVVQPKRRPALEVLFPPIVMPEHPPLEEGAPISCEISNPAAIPDYPRCKWPGTDIRTPPRFECASACVFGRPYCQEHWMMSVAMSKRASASRSNIRPRSGGILRIPGGVNPSDY